MHLVQMCVQGRWISDSALLTLPHIDHSHIEQLSVVVGKFPATKDLGVMEVTTLAELVTISERDGRFLMYALGKVMPNQQVSQVGVLMIRLCIIISHINVMFNQYNRHIVLWSDINYLPSSAFRYS